MHWICIGFAQDLHCMCKGFAYVLYVKGKIGIQCGTELFDDIKCLRPTIIGANTNFMNQLL